MNYQPKGGMCANCANALKKCSQLPFYSMPPIKKEGDLIIVRCTEYKHHALPEDEGE